MSTVRVSGDARIEKGGQTVIGKQEGKEKQVSCQTRKLGQRRGRISGRWRGMSTVEARK